MKITSATFELLPSDPPPGPWVARVVIKGEGFEGRVAPLVALVGDVEVDVIRTSDDGLTASGLLMAIPSEGAPLSVGFLDDPELTATDITFHVEPA